LSSKTGISPPLKPVQAGFNRRQSPLILYCSAASAAPAPGPPNASIRVTENLVLNDPSKIIGVTPGLPVGKLWYVRVRTRSGGGKELKETREIMSAFAVQKA
jgi:hypothetical protein